MSNPSITADKTPWYQWDTGLTVTVSGGAMNECHFANRKQGTAYVQAVINGVARVPDELLQVAAPIKAYGYISDGAVGQTYIEQSFEVIERNIPADYTYTKTAQKTIRDAEVARDQAVKAAKDAKTSALDADDSAIEASKSAQSAGDSASSAETSASNAAKSAGDAAKSASDASSAKVAAQTAKDGAETAASNAATSASNAATSAENAANSAMAAADSVGAINVVSPKTVNNPTENTGGEFTIAIGQRGNVTSSYSICIGTSAIADGDPGSVALGTSAKAHGVRSVAIGAGSVANKENEFSIGHKDRLREITHVSAPTNDTSASTKKYTDDNDANTLSEAKKYTDDNTSNALIGKVSGKLLHVEDAWPSKPLSVAIDGAYKQSGTPSPTNPVSIEVLENPVLRVTGADTSAAGVSLPITLPAEHPYLAALPDGTHDEIVIDKEGNASLVARVSKTETAAADGVSATVGTDALSSTGALDDGATVYYKIATPITYPLGKLDIPSLPETISNVYVSVELTPNCHMTYKRDVNIVIADLTAQIAELKGTR